MYEIDRGRFERTCVRQDSIARDKSTCAETILDIARATRSLDRVARMTNPTEKEPPIEPGAVPIAPGLEDAAANVSPAPHFRAPPEYAAVDRRTIGICGGAIVIAIAAGLAAQVLIRLIGLVTNATF